MWQSLSILIVLATVACGYRVTDTLGNKHEPEHHSRNYERPHKKQTKKVDSFEEAQFLALVDAVKIGRKNITIPEDYTPNLSHKSNRDLVLQLQLYALTLWVSREWINLYSKFQSDLTLEEERRAIATFNRFAFSGSQIDGRGVVLFDYPRETLEDIIDIWESDGMMSSANARVVKLLLVGGSGHKFSRQPAHNDGAVMMVVNDVGFGSLSHRFMPQTEPRGNLMMTVQYFEFRLPLVYTSHATKTCIIWGMICQTEYKVSSSQQTLTGEEQTDLHNFFLMTAKRQYLVNVQPFMEALMRESLQYERFLPEIFRDDYRAVQAQPNRLPEDVIPRDLLKIDDYV